MSAILPFIKIDSASLLAQYFTPYQMCWIEAEDPLHEAKQQVFALAEKSVRIGWTFCDGFKNVRKRLRFSNRDYLFVTKDWPSALEYMNQVYEFAGMMGYTRAVLSHGEDFVKVKSLDPQGRPTALTEEVKIGYIKFQNGSRIIAFSSNPYAMAVYGGDVGIDEFAKHPNAKLLWQTAQARVTWACDLAVWSSHDGEDTLFNQFAQQARAACRARAGSEEIFQQSYMCNPLGAATASIVEWSAIERCRFDYEIERVHLEADDVRRQFGEFSTHRPERREGQIEQFLRDKFPA